jgi:hypothetical protein
MTRSRVSGLTSVYPLSALETVPTDTPLRRASSLIVVRPEGMTKNVFGVYDDPPAAVKLRRLKRDRA